MNPILKAGSGGGGGGGRTNPHSIWTILIAMCAVTVFCDGGGGGGRGQ